MLAMEIVKLSQEVKTALEVIRDGNGHTSLDSAAREVLRDAGYEVGDE